MPSRLFHGSRHVSSSATPSTLSASPPALPSGEQSSPLQSDERSSQSSQSSRIVQVPQNDAHDQARLVVARIEQIFESMVDVLAEGGDALTIPYRSRNALQQPLTTLNFPGRTVNEATKFNRMMRIMELSRDALVSGRLITKRSIYYQDPELFKDQATVDNLVDDLACTLGVGRNALRIVAASKGLLAGPLKLTMADGSVLCYHAAHDSNDLVPPASSIQQIDFANTRWILVIEKEATFRTLAASQYWQKCAHGQGIIVTGKGYPDLATLEFLTLVHTVRPLVPMLCIVDCDPHGIDIMRMYKHGSRGLGHEQNARVPGLQWLGVKMDDILQSANRPRSDEENPQISGSQPEQPVPAALSQESHIFTMAGSASQPSLPLRGREQRSATDALMALTWNDRKTAQRIFEALTGEEERELDQEELEQLRELQVMLMLNMKAEIQAIDNMGDLSDWLDEKMRMA